MLRSRQKIGAFTLAVLLGWSLAHAVFATSAAELAKVAEAFAVQAHAGARFPVSVRAGIPDGLLQLPECSGPPSAQLPIGAHWMTRTLVQIRCEKGARWSILVPVELQSSVPVLVLRAAVLRGAKLAPEDLLRELRQVPGTSADYVNSPDALLRHHVRRNLGAGSALNASDLEPDTLVRRGQMVSVIAEMAGMRIESDAIAMADGRSGEHIRLQNRSSLKVFEGVVDNEGTVRILP